MNLPQYIGEKEVSKMTGIAVQTLRNWRHTGRGLPYAKVGRSVRYCVDDAVEFMENRKILPRERG